MLHQDVARDAAERLGGNAREAPRIAGVKHLHQHFIG